MSWGGRGGACALCVTVFSGGIMTGFRFYVHVLARAAGSNVLWYHVLFICVAWS